MKTNRYPLFKILCFVLSSLSTIAQDDLLKELDKQSTPQAQNTSATFKSTRIINGHSVENVAAKHLDFRISHRFGTLNSGFNNLFGLDESRIRLGLEYGITDKLMIGLGRSSHQKTYDYFVKYKAIRQTNKVPVTVSLFANAATNTQNSSPDLRFYNNTERQSYCLQALIARKFNENVSLQLSPTFLHRNKVETPTDANSLVAIGMGGRYKISKRTSLNAEYFLNTTKRDEIYKNALQIGFDIETGGHVFQLHFSNSRGMVENQFIGGTTGSWSKGDIFYGFNISRVFSFDNRAKGMFK
jgi:Membrane bound beta barrel domain (DUF5777)